MKPDTIIYDMDGLLIDSEPLWHQAAQEVMGRMGIPLDDAAYATTIGLRTKEFLQHWFRLYHIDPSLSAGTEQAITERVIELVRASARTMPGVEHSLALFRGKGFRIGLATSSPLSLVDAMLDRTGLHDAFDAICSASELAYGKPHPQVYLDCATALRAEPVACICIEDSFNGMIAAKAARMQCIVVPEPSVYHQDRWLAADLKLPSLQELQDWQLEVLGC